MLDCSVWFSFTFCLDRVDGREVLCRKVYADWKSTIRNQFGVQLPDGCVGSFIFAHFNSTLNNKKKNPLPVHILPVKDHFLDQVDKNIKWTFIKLMQKSKIYKYGHGKKVQLVYFYSSNWWWFICSASLKDKLRWALTWSAESPSGTPQSPASPSSSPDTRTHLDGTESSRQPEQDCYKVDFPRFQRSTLTTRLMVVWIKVYIFLVLLRRNK